HVMPHAARDRRSGHGCGAPRTSAAPCGCRPTSSCRRSGFPCAQGTRAAPGDQESFPASSRWHSCPHFAPPRALTIRACRCPRCARSSASLTMPYPAHDSLRCCSRCSRRSHSRSRPSVPTASSHTASRSVGTTMGIRMAIGASRGDVVRLVLTGGGSAALIGIILGVAGALVLSRIMRGLVYGVTTLDPLTFLGVPLLLAGAALAAC